VKEVVFVNDFPHAAAFYSPLVEAMRQRFSVRMFKNGSLDPAAADLVVLPYRTWEAPGNFIVDHAPLYSNRLSVKAHDYEVWSSPTIELLTRDWGIAAKRRSWATGFFFVEQLDFKVNNPEVAFAYFAHKGGWRGPRTDVGKTLLTLCHRFERVYFCFHLFEDWKRSVRGALPENLVRIDHGRPFWQALAEAGTVLCDYSSVLACALADPRKQLYIHHGLPWPQHKASQFFDMAHREFAYLYSEQELDSLLLQVRANDAKRRDRERWAVLVHGESLGRGATEKTVDAMEEAIDLRARYFKRSGAEAVAAAQVLT
jgi:hypothetical protein